jgi:shikimate dehydrogenase
MQLRDKSKYRGTFASIRTLHGAPYRFWLDLHPAETQFLKSKDEGAQIKNGLDMLVFFRQKSGKIWNK